MEQVWEAEGSVHGGLRTSGRRTLWANPGCHCGRPSCCCGSCRGGRAMVCLKGGPGHSPLRGWPWRLWFSVAHGAGATWEGPGC